MRRPKLWMIFLFAMFLAFFGRMQPLIFIHQGRPTIQPKDNLSINPVYADLLHQQFVDDLDNLQIPSSDCKESQATTPVTKCSFNNFEVPLNFTLRQFPSNYNPDLCFGGYFQPRNCKARNEVAIIVPYRNRTENLKGTYYHFHNVSSAYQPWRMSSTDQEALELLYHLHTLLPTQKVSYKIYVIEQVANQTFNKAQLMNIGYVIAKRQHVWDCYVFHDVDLYPLFDKVDYSCSENPRVLHSGVEGRVGQSYREHLFYEGYFGGVVQLTKKHMETVNGFSNLYWGWGREDDDMALRLSCKNLSISYAGETESIFFTKRMFEKDGTELQNERSDCNVEVLKYVRKSRRNMAAIQRIDGLSNVKARIRYASAQQHYTLINIDLLESATKFSNCSNLLDILEAVPLPDVVTEEIIPWKKKKLKWIKDGAPEFKNSQIFRSLFVRKQYRNVFPD